MKAMSQLCERARAWASLRADGELSELESALLDGHLERCADCRSFAAGADRVTLALRSTRLERPGPLAVRPITHPGPRSTIVRAVQVAFVAALVVAVGFVAASATPSQQAETSKPIAMVASVDSPDGLRELRRPGLIGKNRVLPRNRFVPGIPV